MRALLGAFMLVASACTTPPRAARESIIGGSADGDDAAAVLILMQTANSEQSCSGVVVAPHVVLTAAHCLDPRVAGSGLSYYVFTGSDLNDTAQANDARLFVRTRALHVHPAYDTSLDAAHDVGAIVTAARLTATPLPLLRRPLAAGDVGAPLRVLGYGRATAGDANSGGTRRQTASRIAAVGDREVVRGDALHGEACEGDSGGPSLMVDGASEVVAALHSWGEHAQSCRGPEHDARVDTALDFIDPIIAAVDPGAAPAPPDAGPPDDAGAPDDLPAPAGGCGVAPRAHRDVAPLLLLLLVALAWRRRRATGTCW